MTRPPLELLASIRAAVEGIRTQVQTMGVPETHWGTLDGADDVLLGALIDLESLESALRAQAEAEANERVRLSNVLERDRTQVAGGVAALGRVLEGYQWLTEGRGPYAYDDNRYQQEFGNALREIAQALEPLRLIGHDLTDCPTLWADVQSARRGLSTPAQADAGGET